MTRPTRISSAASPYAVAVPPSGYTTLVTGVSTLLGGERTEIPVGASLGMNPLDLFLQNLVKGTSHLSLGQEAVDRLGPLEARAEDLERHVLLVVLVLPPGEIDRAHPAGAAKPEKTGTCTAPTWAQACEAIAEPTARSSRRCAPAAIRSPWLPSSLTIVRRSNCTLRTSMR